MKPRSRGLDRGLVVVRFNPFGGRNLIDPIEAIKPVTCQCQNPFHDVANATPFGLETTMEPIGFINVEDRRSDLLRGNSTHDWKQLGGPCVVFSLACEPPCKPGYPLQKSQILIMNDKSIVYEKPSDVRAVDGSVEVTGPDAVDVTLTAEAAEETSERLLAESFRARGQRRLKGNPHQPNDK